MAGLVAPNCGERVLVGMNTENAVSEILTEKNSGPDSQGLFVLEFIFLVDALALALMRRLFPATERAG